MKKCSRDEGILKNKRVRGKAFDLCVAVDCVQM